MKTTKKRQPNNQKKEKNLIMTASVLPMSDFNMNLKILNQCRNDPN